MNLNLHDVGVDVARLPCAPLFGAEHLHRLVDRHGRHGEGPAARHPQLAAAPPAPRRASMARHVTQAGSPTPHPHPLLQHRPPGPCAAPFSPRRQHPPHGPHTASPNKPTDEAGTIAHSCAADATREGGRDRPLHTPRLTRTTGCLVPLVRHVRPSPSRSPHGVRAQAPPKAAPATPVRTCSRWTRASTGARRCATDHRAGAAAATAAGGGGALRGHRPARRRPAGSPTQSAVLCQSGVQSECCPQSARGLVRMHGFGPTAPTPPRASGVGGVPPPRTPRRRQGLAPGPVSRGEGAQDNSCARGGWARVELCRLSSCESKGSEYMYRSQKNFLDSLIDPY